MSSSSEHVVELVDSYLHDLLNTEQAWLVEQHCARCVTCQAALNSAKQRFELLGRLPSVEASEDLLQRTESLLDAEQARHRNGGPPAMTPVRTDPERARVNRLAACIVAGLFLLVGLSLAGAQAYYAVLQPSPVDLQVLGERQLLAGVPTALRVLICDRAQKLPLPDVPVTIELLSQAGLSVVQVTTFRTDQHGTGQPTLKIPDDLQGEFQLRVRAATSLGVEEISQQVEIKRSWQVMLSTDKPVYQPGQTIRMRSLALRRLNHLPVAGEPAEFRLTDPKGNVVFHERAVTSRFGITSADCPLAEEILEGKYQLTCQVGDTSSSATVEVKKYVLPKFRIDVELDRAWYAPGELLKGTLQCDYFFGRPVSRGQASIEMRAMAGNNVELLTTLAGETDQTGRTQFEYRLPDRIDGDAKENGDARLSVAVSMMDTAGQSHSKTATCLVTNRPLRVQVIPEGGKLLPGRSNKVYLLATYADGRPAPNLRIAISGVRQEVVTDRLGVGVVELSPAQTDSELTLSTRDDAGHAVTQRFPLEFDTDPNSFVLIVDKPVVKGGTTLNLTAVGLGSQPIFVDLIKDGQILLTDSLAMPDGRGSLAIDLPAELSGTVQVCAYRMLEKGPPVCRRQAIYIDSASELRIQTTTDKPEYRPGETARLQFQLHDRQGRPVAGALSLSAVDEAVFAVSTEQPVLQSSFFNVDEALLQPIAAIYPWSPEKVAGAPDELRNRLERALFAATATSVLPSQADTLEQLLPFLDNDRRILEVLQRPDWKELAGDRLSPEIVAALDVGDGLHTLVATSLSAKTLRMEQQRLEANSAFQRYWEIYVAGLFVTFTVWILVVYIRRLIEWIIIISVIAVLMTLLLPAVEQAREASRRTMVRSDLRRIGFAMTNFQEVHGHLPQEAAAANGPSPRMREWFPETLLWRPELITDDQGKATLELPLADSITNWRLTASAVSADGALGGVEESVRVFQPFFVDLSLPVALTRGDQVTLQAVVYNYLDQPQTVTLELTDGNWFKRLGDKTLTLELPAGGVQSVSFPIQVQRVGRQEVQLTARGGEVADAVKRTIEVVPDGQPVERIVNGNLSVPAVIEWEVPPEAIEGSARAIVKIYPSDLSQIVEGLDGIFQVPHGCFEQTSSTTYPNVLALDYLQRIQQDAPAVQKKAREYIHLGYQRLLSFEVAGGGFDWFGQPPANRTLTAYGLMEFQDMARVHEVDRALIVRTREWLLAQRNSDGTWNPEGHGLHEDPTRGGGESDIRYRTTAYLAWAVFGGRPDDRRADSTVAALLARAPGEIDDPYDLALVCNALQSFGGRHADAHPYLARLYQMRQQSEDGKQIWWQQAPARRTVFYGARDAATVETTALAVLALLESHNADPGYHSAAHRGLQWLATQRTGYGTWPSTQANVLALKALVAGARRPAHLNADRRIDIEWQGKIIRELTIPAAQSEVVQQIELRDEIVPGSQQLKITDRSGSAASYQVDLRYHRPAVASPKETEPLTIGLHYNKTELQIDEAVTAEVQVQNHTEAAIPMVLLDLPLPAGFIVETTSLQKLVDDQLIAKFQQTPRSIHIYLRSLGQEGLTLGYVLRPTLAVTTTTPPAVAYDYYAPQTRGASQPAQLVVKPEE